MTIKTPNAKFGNPNSMMNAQVNNPHEKDFPSTYLVLIRIIYIVFNNLD